jgi:aldose 1-epimerase
MGLMVLRNADSRVTLDAGHGGGVREFNWRGWDIFRPAASAATEPMSLACFPLVPYANRIAQGRFSFAGHEVRLRPNWERDPHPLHGQGWQRPWTLEQHSATQARMEFLGGGDEWPWRYRAVQEFSLHGAALDIRLSLENLSQDTMPGMLGLHPYFPQPALATVEARARTVWLTDAQSLPVQEVLAPQDWSFERPRGAARVGLDHCFDHWDGIASIRWPDRFLKMTASGCRALHVFTPPGLDFFCLEPQTAEVGALNRGSAAVARLAAGERLDITVSFSVGQS